MCFHSWNSKQTLFPCETSRRPLLFRFENTFNVTSAWPGGGGDWALESCKMSADLLVVKPHLTSRVLFLPGPWKPAIRFKSKRWNFPTCCSWCNLVLLLSIKLFGAELHRKAKQTKLLSIMRWNLYRGCYRPLLDSMFRLNFRSSNLL